MGRATVLAVGTRREHAAAPASTCRRRIAPAVWGPVLPSPATLGAG